APGLTVGKIFANDGNIAWTEQNPVILQTNPSDTVGIRTSDLTQSGNFIRVTVTGDGLAGTKDKIYANWFEVDYDRDLKASPGAYFKFPFDTTRGDTFSFDIRQFNHLPVEVWKLGHSRLTNCDSRWIRLADEGASYHTRFQLITDQAYEILAFDQNYPKPPKAIVPEYGTRDLRHLTGAEYLIIYHDSFADEPALRSLDSLRRVTFNGLVDTFRVSEVYDQFSDGIVNPEAIQRFLKYAYENWPVRPTHVCLIGDGLLNNRSTYYAAGYMIPSFYVPTYSYGLSSAEVLFGCVSGVPSDLLPDIAVGRISCRSAAELDVYVEKLLRYENPALTDYSSPFHSRFLFVNDKRDATFNFDREFSEPAIKLLPDYCNVSRVYLDSLPAGQGRTTLRNAFRDGSVVINYNGHGGGGQWSGTTLMDVPTVALLNNGHAYPFITNFTCYVGSFDANEQGEVLGEAFLFSRNSRLDPVGGIGVYSTVSVGWARNGALMQTKLFDFLADLPPLTLGEIVQFNKIRYWGQQQYPYIDDPRFSMMMNMTLLGDPGVKLALPQQVWSDVQLDTNVAHSADTLYISGTLPWDPQGNVTNLYVLPYNGDFRTYETSFYYTDRSKTPAFNTSLILPEIVRTRTFDSVLVPVGPLPNRQFISPMGTVVVYAAFPGTDELAPRDAVASIPIYHADSLGDLRVFELEILPNGFIPDDSVFRIEAGLTHRQGIQSARLRGVFRPAQGPVELDTVSLSLTSEGRWQTPDLGPHRVFGGRYQMQIFARPFGEEDEVSTPEQTLTIEKRPDYSISSSSINPPRLYPGDVPEYSVMLTNSAGEATEHHDGILLRLTGVHDTTYYDSTLGRTVTMPADSFVSDLAVPNPWQMPPLFEARVSAPFRAGSYRVTLMLDPDSLITETNETNNRYQTTLTAPNIFPADNLVGTYLPRLAPPAGAPHVFWKSNTADTVWLRMLPGFLPASPTSLIYTSDSLSTAEATPLAAIGLYPVAAGQSVPTFRVTLADTSELLAGDGVVRISKTFSDLADSIGVAGLALFMKRSDSDAWLRLRDQTVESMRRDTTYPPGGGIQIRWRGRLSGEAPGLGTFAVFRYADARGPDITISAEGVRFTPHSILPRQPEIYVLLSDLSGIDRSPGRFFLVLDNDTVPEAEIGWSDSSGWGGSMNAVFRPRLEPGSHVLRVRATDTMGNPDSLTTDFEVRGTFGIEWAINYPNPFQKSTVISYALTDITDDFVEVKIYTVSGRQIKTLREGTRAVANYREITWDGTDMHGGEVANGVYFAKIKAKQGNQEVEKIVKLAKVR
ncbi:MAG: C25 family cysteine peptidase, partial [bacterium]|nr:C25 family cysteine peptidase [bacterium]